MSPGELVKGLKQHFGDAVVPVQETPDLVVEIPGERLLEVAVYLRDTPGYHFNFLVFITAVDRVDFLEVVYGLRSLEEKHSLILKVKTTATAPAVPSVTSVWPAADWDERETFDLFGVLFTGHPNLKRILLTDDWEGHPLLKSYPVNKRPVLEV